MEVKRRTHGDVRLQDILQSLIILHQHVKELSKPYDQLGIKIPKISFLPSNESKNWRQSWMTDQPESKISPERNAQFPDIPNIIWLLVA